MVYSYNISVADVLAQYPTQDATQITANSKGVNHAVIETFRDQGSAILNNLCARHGIDPELLDESGEAMLRDAVIAFVIGKCLVKLGRMEQGRAYMDQFDMARKILREMPQDLGNNQRAAEQVHTNIPDAPCEPDRWSSQEGSRWGGW